MKAFVNKCRNGLLFRYFFSYLAIFLLPFLILTFALYYSSVLGMEKQLKTANLNSLRQVDTMLNERFSELDKLSDSIKLNPRLSNFMLEHPYYSIEARSELGKLQANNTFISELFIRYRGNDHIYSSNGTQSLSSLTETKYSRFKLSESNLVENFDEKIPSVKVSYSQQAGQPDTLLQYYRPLTNGGSIYGTAFFFIQDEELQRMLDNLMTDYRGSALIINQQGEIINSSDSSVKLSKTFDLSLLKKEEAVIDEQKYHISSLTSELTGLTFVKIVDAKQFLEPLANIRNLFYLLIVIFLVVGLGLSYMMGLRQYRPIKQIDNAFRKITNQEEKSEDDELTFIERRLSSFVTERQTLTATLSQQQAHLTDYFFSHLIEGEFKDEAFLFAKMEELSIELCGNQFYVMLLDTQFTSKVEDNVKKKTVLLNEFPVRMEQTEIYAVELPLKNQLALIVGTQQNDTNQVNQVKKIKKKLDGMLDEEVQLDVGEVYSQLDYVNRSYIEAISAKECHRSHSKEAIFFYKDIVYSQPQFLSIPSELKSKLTQSLHQGDEIVVVETLRTIFAHDSLATMTTSEAKYYYFDVLSTLINCVSSLGYEDLLERFNEIVEYHSSETLYQDLSELARTLCQNISAKKIADTTQLESDIIVYLNKHFRSHDLSLEQIAIEFDFSISYLSRFIKEETGITFSTYVQEKRLNYIKNQLITTEEPIKDIVMSAGYYDVSNYTRKFKNIVGVTPGQFRKQMRDDHLKPQSN